MNYIKNYLFGVYGVLLHIVGFILLFLSFTLIPHSTMGYVFLGFGSLLFFLDWFFLFINSKSKKNLYYIFILQILIFVVFFMILYLEVPILKDEKNQFWNNLKTFLTFLFIIGIFASFLWRTIISYTFYIEKIEKSFTTFSFLKQILQIIGIVLILIFFNLLLIRWDYQIDLTKGYYSFSKNAHEIIKSIQNQHIGIFVFLPDQQLVQSKRNTTTAELYNISEELRILFKSITRINPTISVEFYNADLLDSNHLSFGNVSNGTIILRNYSRNIDTLPYIERRIYVTNQYDLERLEENFIRTLLQIASDPIKIYVSTGYGERYISPLKKPFDIDFFIDILKMYNFEVLEWNDTKGFPNKIPQDCEILLFAGPTGKFLQETKEAIIEFIEKRSGKAFILINPDGSEDFHWIFENFSPNYKLVKENLIHIEGKPNLIYTDQLENLELTRNFKQIERKRFLLLAKSFFYNQQDKNFVPKYEKYQTKEFLYTPFSTWIDKNQNLKKDKEEKNQRFSLGILIEKEASKIVLVSDTEWITNRILTQNLYNLNIELATDILFYLGNRMNLKGIGEKKRENQSITISENDKSKLFLLGILVIPIVLIGLTTLTVYVYNKQHKFKKEVV